MQGVKVKFRGIRVYVFLDDIKERIVDVCLPGSRTSIASTMTKEERVKLKQRVEAAVLTGRMRDLGMPA